MIIMPSTTCPYEAIDTALAAHAAWKQRFSQFMAGTIDLDPEQVEQNNVCVFGKWLEGESAHQLPPQDYELVNRLHIQFHRVAAAIVRLKKEGHIEEAQAHLRIGGDFPKASAQLNNCLIAIRDKGIALLNQQLDAAQN
jgi:Chemoreceptor zinc-binding domain